MIIPLPGTRYCRNNRQIFRCKGAYRWWKYTFGNRSTYYPDEILKLRFMIPEYPASIVMAGGWMTEGDWKLVLRLTTGKYLKRRADKIFQGVWAPYKDEILKFQLQGGLITTQNKLRKKAKEVYTNYFSTAVERCAAKLVIVITEDDQHDQVLHALQYSRLAMGYAEEKEPEMVMVVVAREMRAQTKLLIKTIKDEPRL